MINKKLVWRCAARINNDEFTLTDLIDELSNEVSKSELSDKKKYYHFNDILKVVTNVLPVTEDQLKSRKRDRPIVQARQISIYLIYKYTQLKLIKTADIFNRDHATALHSIRVIKDAKKGYNPEVKELIDKCEKMLMMEKINYVKEVSLVKDRL
jgi:chromosomal replication initiator protein